MRMSRTGLIALCAAASALMAPVAMAQGYSPPRTPDGKPDLQGTWTNSSITTLERTNASLPLVLDAAQVAGMEKSRLQQEVSANSRTNPDEGAPTAGANVGGYNAFWLDRGMKVGVVHHLDIDHHVIGRLHDLVGVVVDVVQHGRAAGPA